MLKHSASPAQRHSLILGFGCFGAYTVCYAGRSVLSAIMPEMLQNTSFTREDFGLMGSAFFITYGIGQIVNGLLGDRIKARTMVSAGLFFAGFTVFFFPHIGSAAAGVTLWGACGLLLSMLWGPLSRVIAENTDARSGKIFMTLLSVASILGTMAAYLAASVSALAFGWQTVFRFTGMLLVSASAAWFACMTYLEKKGALRGADRHTESGGAPAVLKNTLLDNAIIPMIFVAAINGIIRNAVAFWIPTYISEKLGSEPAAAAGISGILPVVSLLGTFAGVLLLKKVRDNEFTVSIVLYAVSAVMFFALWLLDGRSFIAAVAFLFTASASMSGQCNMIFGIFCMRFRETGRVSAISGFLNFTSYASASAASSAFIWLVAASGWGPVVLVWTGLTFAGGVLSLLAYQRARAACPS